MQSQPRVEPQKTSNPRAAARALAIAKLAGPTVISLAALAISFLAFTDQKSANQYQEKLDRSEIASQASIYADKVSWWLQHEDTNPELTIGNRSTATVTDVIFYYHIHVIGVSSKREPKLVLIQLPDVPPCTIEAAPEALDPDVGDYMGKFYSLQMYPKILYEGISFTDGKGRSWRVANTLGTPNAVEKLVPGSILPVKLSQIGAEDQDESVKLSAADGCS
jgi:hypothetical protein